MKNVTYITGNPDKARYFSEYLGEEIGHQKVDLDEIQSIDLETVVRHKVHQAYAVVNAPVLVEDTSIEFAALGRLPGPLVKWFIKEIGLEAMCRLIDGETRIATARSMIGYFDGEAEHLFTGSCPGTIAEHPRGTDGFGWDAIFIPDGQPLTNAELDPATYQQIFYTASKPFDEVRDFLIEKA